MKFVQLALVSFAVVGLLAACSWAAVDSDEMVPQNAKSAKDVLSNLKDQGATNIRHIEFDNNQWNVKTQHGQKEVQHEIDAKSGEITAKHEESEYETAPPSNVIGILEVANIVQGQGLNGIREIEYDDSLWKVEVVQDGKVTKLCLDPIAGDVIWKDTKPITTKGDDSGESSMKSKLEKVRGAIKERFMKEQSEQDQSTNQGTDSQSGQNSSSTSQMQESKTQSGSTQSGSSQSGSSTSGSSKSGSSTYQPW